MTDTTSVTLKLPFEGFREFRLHGSSRDESIPTAIRNSGGFYEPEVMTLLRQVIAPGATCLDIGANLGALTLAMSAFAPRGRVFAFEPIPENFELLQRNIAENGVTNAEAVRAGCFSEPKTLEFHYVEEFAGGAFLSPLGVSDHRERRVQVPCTTVDLFAAERGLARVDVMKIDVEGAEEDVIAGARSTLARDHPRMVVEFNPAVSEKLFGRSLRSLYALLESSGYELHLIQRWHASGLARLGGFDDLMARVRNQGDLGDVYCHPRGEPLPGAS